MKNALKTLAKSVMIPLGLIAVAVDTGINNKIKIGMTTLITNNSLLRNLLIGKAAKVKTSGRVEGRSRSGQDV